MALILIVDDDDGVRAGLRKSLTHFGHQVVEAVDGAEGAAKADECRPNLVITDLVMPDSEGMALIMVLRRRHPGLPVIAISGGGKRGAAGDYLRTASVAGVAAALQKPFTLDELRTAVNVALGPSRAASGATV